MKNTLAILIFFIFISSAFAQQGGPGPGPTTSLPLPTPSTLGGVISSLAPSNQYSTGIGTNGASTYSPIANGSITAAMLQPNLQPEVIVFATKAAFVSGPALPSTITSVKVTSVSGVAPGTYGIATSSLDYSKGTSTPTGIYGEVLNNGIYWEPLYSSSPVNAGQFGVIGDATWNASTGVVSGPSGPGGPSPTDNTTSAQAAINYALQHDYNTVCFPDGAYYTTDTLQMGWGQGIYSLSLVSCNNGRAPFSLTAGVTLLPIFPNTVQDRCAINMQGARQDAIRDIAIIGQNYAYILNIVIGSETNPFPVTAAGWLNPTIAPASGSNNPGGLQQHSPYSAICVDAYSGTAPADAYPNVTFPAWTGITTQYGKLVSSDIEITNVSIYGFAVGINNKPNGDGNGDFLKTDKFTCEQTVYCESIGNTQSRAVQFSNIAAGEDYTLITNNQFGEKEGQIDGPLVNIATSLGYQIFQIGQLGASGPIVFSNLYGEAVVRLGTFSAPSAFSHSIIFDGLFFDIGDQVTQVMPAALIEVYGATPPNLNPNAISITCNACTIAAGGRIDTFVHGNASIIWNAGQISNGYNLPTLFGTTPIQQAENYTGGLFIGSAMTFPTYPYFQSLKWLGTTTASYMASPTAPLSGAQIMGENADFSLGLRAQFTQATRGLVDSANVRQWTFALGPTGAPLSIKTGGANVSVGAAISSCDTMTFTYIASYQTASRQSSFIYLGDILYHLNTGTIFVVTAIGAPDGSGNYPITTRQLNNMNVSTSAGACTQNNISDIDVGGITYLVHTGILNIPQKVFLGTFASGSSSVTNVMAAGGASDLASYVVAGDYIWNYPLSDSYFQWPYTSGGTINSVTPGSGSGSITLSANATISGRFPILPLPVVGGPQ